MDAHQTCIGIYNRQYAIGMVVIKCKWSLITKIAVIAQVAATRIPTGNITLPVRDLAFGYAVATTEGVMTDYGLMIQGTEANCLAIAEGDIIIAGTDDGVYRSADWGKSFERTGFPGRSVYELTAHPAGAVYASVSTDYGAGVYRSRNAGGSWQQYDSGLINRVVISFCIDGEGDLLAGTFGLGVMKARP